MADQNVHPFNMAFSQSTDTGWQVGAISIKRRHLVGYPWTRESFIYSVTASWRDLCTLGITQGVTLPEGRKRTNSGHLSHDNTGWRIDAVKGGRWELSLRLNDRHPSLEALIAGQPTDPNHVPWKGPTDTHREARQIGKARRDTAFQGVLHRLLEPAK